MENSKIYEALMAIFEEEKKYFSEKAFVNDEELQEELEKCYEVNEQIAFADKHWDKIANIYFSQWEKAYEGLLELRSFYPKKKKVIRRKKTV